MDDNDDFLYPTITIKMMLLKILMTVLNDYLHPSRYIVPLCAIGDSTGEIVTRCAPGINIMCTWKKYFVHLEKKNILGTWKKYFVHLAKIFGAFFSWFSCWNGQMLPQYGEKYAMYLFGLGIKSRQFFTWCFYSWCRGCLNISSQDNETFDHPG